MVTPNITIDGKINLTELIEKMMEEKLESLGSYYNIKVEIAKLEGSDLDLSKKINSLRDGIKILQDSLVIRRIENLEKEIRDLKGLPVKLSSIASKPVKIEIVPPSHKKKISQKGQPLNPPNNPTMWKSGDYELVANWIENGKPSKHLHKLLKPMGLAKPKQLRVCGFIVGMVGTAEEIATACSTDFTYVYNIKKRLAKAQFPKWSEDLLK